MSQNSKVYRTIKYRSSHDGVYPLFMDVAFPSAKGKCPLIVVMHGYNGSRKAITPTIKRLAVKGLFAIAPDMRGRGDSAGEFDSGVVEIMDIYDAIQFIIGEYAPFVDERSVNIVGYSGGGGNALSAATKFTDLFRVAASFFGISNYALWYETKGRPDCNETMVRVIGGCPEEVPDRYAARSSLFAVRNNSSTRIFLFWDEEETNCPPILNLEFKKASLALGYTNCILRESKKRDKNRWFHGYPSKKNSLIAAEDEYVSLILGGKVPEPRFPVRGNLAVAGFVVTRNFQLWVGDGQSGTAIIDYDTRGDRPKIQVREITKGQALYLKYRDPNGRDIKLRCYTQ